MCGITGWVNFEQDISKYKEILDAMNFQVEHRGPDATGTWIAEHVALGHRRLSIIDPQNGIQPMVKQIGERKYVIVYNGELYNMDELRSSLLSKGYQFNTKCDTELIPAAFSAWREDAPKELNGIFGFAIWDESKEELFIARDRIGVKPLFYTIVGKSLLFGSELKSILAHPDVPREIDEQGLNELLIMGPARTPGVGVFRNIHELKPGHWLRFNRDGLTINPYWELVSDFHQDDVSTTIAKVRELFQDAVSRQLVSDVPIGTMLSGGLDSSALAAYAAKVFRQENRGTLSTFSVDYADNDKYFKQNEFQPNSDAPWVKVMAEHIGSKHQNVILDNEQLYETLMAAMRSRDLPGMADVDASLLLFSKAIKEDLTVILSGECADEVFGGYPWFHRDELVNADTFPWARLAHLRVPFLTNELVEHIKPLEYVDNRYQEALSEVPRLQEESAKDARIREIFYLSLTRWMPTLLDRKDRMSMAAGLEVRVPFCDHRLVEYVWNVPWSMKFMGNREKGLLRQAVSHLLPKEVMERKKSPYPKTHHPGYLTFVTQKMQAIVENNNAPIFQLLDREKVKKFLQTDLRNQHFPWFGQLMNVPALLAYWLQLNEWLISYRVSIK
ncbi:asparagine synthase (glutamine-hydrolyzing) [Shimazuella kribbensis]|uniref:asparagine synthase (glutamine-hydrolyzing) n=1 Tax=Shimazuella kribbensis TaxID=139808 RepID=UPI000404E692|nr:asparagine synthase (glutamine-hydrolyzing) [Shimazuella kribbensis]